MGFRRASDCIMMLQAPSHDSLFEIDAKRTIVCVYQHSTTPTNQSLVADLVDADRAARVEQRGMIGARLGRRRQTVARVHERV